MLELKPELETASDAESALDEDQELEPELDKVQEAASDAKSEGFVHIIEPHYELELSQVTEGLFRMLQRVDLKGKFGLFHIFILY